MNIRRKIALIASGLLFLCLQVSAQTVSLKLGDVTVQKAINELKERNGYSFVFDSGDFDTQRKVSVNATDLKTAVEQITRGQAVSYVIQGKNVVVTKLTSNVAAGPAKTIKGYVLDDKGEPLPGATVQVANTTTGVLTDLDGAYQIKASGADQLVFSFIGMKSQVVAVGGKAVINVNLSVDNDELDEAVVVAFGTQKKEDVLASVASVKPSELKVPTSNLTTALAGRVSGLVSYQRSGEPGSDDASFFVRGVTSFSYAASPLILIDGVEMTSTDLARMQPDDIASFSILKDAAATALYGARGANGVIMITSREGHEGPASISFRYETSVSQPTQTIELADPVTYMKLNNEAATTRDPSAALVYSQSKIDNTIAGTNPYVYPANDWYNLLFKQNTVNHRANFNVNGGGKVAKYYIAGTMNQDNGVLRTVEDSQNNIDLKRYQIRSNVTIAMTKTTNVTVRLTGTFDDYKGPIDGGSEIYEQVMRTDPVAFPAYYLPDAANENTQHILFGNAGNGDYINPYANLVRGYKGYSKSKVNAQIELKQDLSFITKGLSARALVSTDRYAGYTIYRGYQPYYYNVGFYDKATDTYTLNCLNQSSGTEYLNYSEGAKTITTTNYGEAVINYDKKFSKNTISAMLVGQIRQYQKANAGSLMLSLPSRNLGLSGRFTYNYDHRYFTEVNFGYNGSERFAENERWGFFPSIGAAWLLTNEPFWQSASNPFRKSVTNLKLKATYGLAGNDQIGDSDDRFFYMSEYNVNNSGTGYKFGTDNGYSVNGIKVSRFGNDEITWEVSRKMNLGVELGLFNELDLQAEYYTEYRSNILMSRADIPSTMGLQVTTKSNVGEASGRGVDLSADWNHSFSKDFWISGRANYTYATSKYEVYEEPDYSATPWKSHVGQSIGQKWGYIAERLFVDDTEVANSPSQNFGTSVVMGGDIKYRDINGDDQITELDMVPIGYPTTPEIIYGFGFSAGFKGFDLSCFFQGLAHESFWISVQSTSPFIDPDTSNSITEKNALLKYYADNHWSENDRNVNALWPRLSTTLNSNNAQTSTWFMRDGSFLRLKSVEFGYKIPDRVLRSMYMKNLRLYVSGSNLLCWSKFKLWDPEMAGDGLGYPVQRVYNFGVQLSF